MEEVKKELNQHRDTYEKSTDPSTRRLLRNRIYETELKLRTLCVQHCGSFDYDIDGFLEYSEIDENHNCKICGLNKNFCIPISFPK